MQLLAKFTKILYVGFRATLTFREARRNSQRKKEVLGGNTRRSRVFPYFLSALPLPKCFTAEQSALKASSVVL